jgi:hypothetical protein
MVMSCDSRWRALEQKTDIQAVELVRRIRDEQAKLLTGKSDEQTIELFRTAGEAASRRAQAEPWQGAAHERVLTATSASGAAAAAGHPRGGAHARDRLARSRAAWSSDGGRAA